METSNMKNIVVLKNLPSNIVDEAIVILKANKNAKKLEYVEKMQITGYKDNTKNKDYIIKEAESIISSYITKIENSRNPQKTSKSMDKKYKRLKAYSIVVSIILIFAFIKSII